MEQVNHLKVLLREKETRAALNKSYSTCKEQASKQEEEVSNSDNLVYLKNIVHKYMASDDPSERETLLPVISTLLHFNAEEIKKIRDQLQLSFLRIQTQGVGDIVGWGKDLFGLR